MKIGILGASGLVGRTMLDLLAQRPWVDTPPRLLVSVRSAGTALPFCGGELVCHDTTAESFAGLDVLLCSAGREAARRWAPVAAGAGALVVDNSSAFRGDPAVPLVVPEINPPELPAGPSGTGAIIANPNCSTIQIAMLAAPLDRAFGLRELHAVTLQAISGAGQKALDEWRRQEQGANPQQAGVFPRGIAGNVLPAIGQAMPGGGFEEEVKVGRELRRILGRGEDLAVTCTAVRVPVRNGHSVAVRCLLDEPVDMDHIRGVLSAWPHLVVAADPHSFATPCEIDGLSIVHIGRLRPDPGNSHGLMAWVVADNLLKGAAWNAVQIVEFCLGLDGASGEARLS